MANDKEREINQKIDDLFKEANEYKKRFVSKWIEQERFYEGNHWKFATERPAKNWCFSIVEGEIPILTDTRPSSSVIPQQPEQMEDAKVLESAMQYVFEEQDQQLKVSEAVRAMLKTGTGWHYVDYDPDGSNGEGSILIKNVNWRYVFIDPTADEIDQAGYAIIKMPIRREELKRKYPNKADEIDEISHLDENRADTQSDGLDPSLWDGIGGTTGYVSETDRFRSDNFITVEEVWLKDYSMEKIDEEETQEEIEKETEEIMNGVNPDVHKYEDHAAHKEAHEALAAQIEAQLQIPVQDPETGEMTTDPVLGLSFAILQDHLEMHDMLEEENPKGQRPKYSHNLRLIIRTGELILFDDESPVGDGMIPLVPFYCYKSAESVYGTGELKNIIDAQKMYNDLDWSEYKGLRLNANSGWVLDKESGVDETTLTNDEGIVITKKVGTEVSRIPPGQISPQLGISKNANRESMEAISGIHEVTQGRQPGGITAASAITALQEQAVGRVRLKSRYLEEYSLLREGKLVASRIVHYWSVERTLRVYDKSGQIQFIDFRPDDIQKLDYKLKLVPGTSAGITKEAILQSMTQLLQTGAILPKTYFEVTDLPSKNKILEDLAQQDELQATAEALAAENEQLKAQLGVAPESMDGQGVAPPPVV